MIFQCQENLPRARQPRRASLQLHFTIGRDQVSIGPRDEEG
jgi:hypothetical protein